MACRTTANATQCWTPAAVSKGFETFLAQAPIDVSHSSPFATSCIVYSMLVKNTQSMQHEPVLMSNLLSAHNLQSDWRFEQVQQLILDSKMHCRTVEKTLNKNKHDMQQAQRALQALQGS